MRPRGVTLWPVRWGDTHSWLCQQLGEFSREWIKYKHFSASKAAGWDNSAGRYRLRRPSLHRPSFQCDIILTLRHWCFTFFSFRIIYVQHIYTTPLHASSKNILFVTKCSQTIHNSVTLNRMKTAQTWSVHFSIVSEILGYGWKKNWNSIMIRSKHRKVQTNAYWILF